MDQISSHCTSWFTLKKDIEAIFSQHTYGTTLRVPSEVVASDSIDQIFNQRSR
ncbi:hypothetical protein NPIL_69751, partial [Nephila pilipes]